MDWVKIFSSADEMERALAVRKPRLLLIGRRRVCLVRTEDRLLAVEDTCPHNGESLSKGSVNFVDEIVCPWHGHQFSLKTGRECSERSRDLQVYPVKTDHEGVFIAL